MTRIAGADEELRGGATSQQTRDRPDVAGVFGGSCGPPFTLGLCAIGDCLAEASLFGLSDDVMGFFVGARLPAALRPVLGEQISHHVLKNKDGVHAVTAFAFIDE
jgi:hypothetical protein